MCAHWVHIEIIQFIVNLSHAEYFYLLLLSPIFIFLKCTLSNFKHIFSIRVENSVDLDQMASPEANWSGSTMFSKKDKS